MLEEIVIRTENADALKPLVRAAMDREAKLLEHSVERTRTALEAFEKRYDMTTQEFERKFKAREIEESLDVLDWWMEEKPCTTSRTNCNPCVRRRLVENVIEGK